MKRKILVLGLVFIGFVPLIIGTLFSTGAIANFRGRRYGVEYNPFRIAVNQPIIEDWFQLQVPQDRSYTWVTPDSLRGRYSHLDKFYVVDAFGDMMYEIDYYRPKLSEEFILNRVPTLDLSQNIEWQLKRYYYPEPRFRPAPFARDSVIYQLLVSTPAREDIIIDLLPTTGDSLVNKNLN